MAFDKAMAHLRAKGFGDRVIVPQEETATVEEAAAALGTAPAQIAKTMACGDDHSGVELSVPELEAASDAQGWVDVCRGWEPED